MRNNKYILFLITVLFIYTSYIGYQCYIKNNLNNSLKAEITLEDNYNLLKSKIEKLDKNITNINFEKDNIKTTIQAQEEAIKKANDEITVKQQKIVKGKINSNSGKVAYLTFDDGPSGNTSEILNILSKYNIKATYFVNGREDDSSLNSYRRIVNEGHSIGNHVYTHRYQNIYTSVNAFDYEFNRLQDLILKTTGVTMNIMRFPGGSNNAISNSYSNGIMDILTQKYKSLGYKYFDWNSSAGDTAPSGVTTTSVINKITNECRYKKFVIILMHDTMPTTPIALESVIQNLASMGFKFMPLSSASPTIQFK